MQKLKYKEIAGIKLTFLIVFSLCFFYSKVNAKTIFELTYSHPQGKGQATVLLDINGDSLPDFITANKGKIGVAINLGAGNFQTSDNFFVDNANGFGSYDFNKDAKLDFSIAQQEGSVFDNWINIGNGTFNPTDMGNESVGATRNVVYADFDNDGFVDSYHSASSFQWYREANQLHAGVGNELFGPDIMDSIMPGFFYDSLEHPTKGPQYWSNTQSKGAIVRDLDGDGFADIINAAYCDMGFQPDTFSVLWLYNNCRRGVFILQNTSSPGNIDLNDVSFAALGDDAYGFDSTFWNAYAPVPLDYDNDGDYDLIIGGLVMFSPYTREYFDTDIIRFYENISTPGKIKFVEKTEEAQLEYLNEQSVDEKKNFNFASGIPIDYDNDGFVDFALVNRKSKGLFHYVHLFRNNGDGTFSQVPFSEHGIGLNAGGRDINVADLNNDGKVDIILSDGTVGGYKGTDSTLVYINNINSSNNWIQLDIKTDSNGTWVFDYTVKVYRLGTQQLLGMDDIRTDFSYRSKRYPVLHFGLGSIDSIDVKVSKSGTTYVFNGLPANKRHYLYLSSASGIEEKNPGNVSVDYRVLQNQPNPVIQFTISHDGHVKLDVFDIAGQRVATLVDEEKRAGTYEVEFDTSRLSSGVYFYVLRAGQHILAQISFLVK